MASVLLIALGGSFASPGALAAQPHPRAPLSTFDYDASADLDIREEGRDERSGYEVVDFTYASPAGSRVPAYLFVPDGEGPFAGIIVMHGMPGSRRNSLRTGERYARAGAVVLAVTAPFSRPDDNPRSNPITFTEQDRDEQIQLIQDLRRGIDLLVANPKVDPARIAYVGGSYGGAMGGLLAGVETRIAAYVLRVGDGGLVAHVTGPDDEDKPFTRFPDDAREAWLAAMEPIEPIRFIGDAAPAALLMQAGRNDRIIPVEDAERYMAAASSPKETRWYDAGHGLNDEAYRDQAQWLEEMIGIDASRAEP